MPQNSCISRVTTKTSSLVQRAWWGMAGFKDLACFTKQKHKARYILSHRELIIWFFKIPCDLAVGSCGGQWVPKFSFSLFLLLLMCLKDNEFSSSTMCRFTRGDPLQTTKWLRCCGCSRFLFFATLSAADAAKCLATSLKELFCESRNGKAQQRRHL